MDRSADIDGSQIKVLDVHVRPARAAQGGEGIPLEDGVALPFVVERRWNAPAGHYPEQWFLVDPSTSEIVYEGPTRRVLIWGLAAWTDVSDEVQGGFPLAPGSYQIVLALGQRKGGEVTVEAASLAPTPGP